jgi:predicted outer membrane repeat protein
MVVLALLITAATACLGAPVSDAEPTEPALMVKNGDDSGNDSLRDVIEHASNGDVIRFDPSVTAVTLESGISFGQENITIDGGSGVTITKDAADTFRLLNCTAAGGTLTLKGLTIENGYAVGIGVTGNGGGVLSTGDILLESCVFLNNRSELFAGACGTYGNIVAVGCTFTGNSTAFVGGGVYANGTVTLTGCTFTGNTSANNGGGVYSNSTVTLTECTFIDNTSDGDGSGVYATENITLDGCGFRNNVSPGGIAYSSGGSIAADNTSFFANTITGNDRGIVRVLGTATLRQCTFTGNMMAASSGYNVHAGSVSIQNCLMTQDGLTGNSNRTITGNNRLGTGPNDYTAWFGSNTLTYNYIMPVPGAAGGAAVISGLEKDAAGGIRGSAGGPCLYGAVDLTAQSWMVTNSNDAGAGSLRSCVYMAENYDTAPLPDLRVVYFDAVDTVSGTSAFDIKINSEISFSENILIYGRLDGINNPEITVDAFLACRVFWYDGTGNAYFYGMNINNGYDQRFSYGGGVYAYSSESAITLKDCALMGNTASYGGGVLSNGNIILVGCKFIGNVANYGGGVYLAQDITLDGCTFIRNTATDHGGGMYTFGNATVTDSTFIGNYSGDGGGMYTFGEATVTGCTFSENRTFYNGGGMYSRGIAVITDCSFTDNFVYNNGGGVYVSRSSVVTQCEFIDNTSNNGGGMYAMNGSTITDCTFIGNSSRYGGGLATEEAVLTGCTFIGNSAISLGGGVYVFYNELFFPPTVTVTLEDCVFTRNSAEKGSAVCAYESLFLMMIDCTVSENTTIFLESGAVDCAAETYLFHCTVTSNNGAGAYAGEGISAYLYNCIAAGNIELSVFMPFQIKGEGIFDLSFGNLVEGENIPGSSPATKASYRQVFGLNVFDPETGTHKVLSNGIAAGKATAVTAAVLSATGLSTEQRADALAALASDQTGAARPSSVTYGAVEASENTLDSLIVTTQPMKTDYFTGNTIDLTGTMLSLTYSNGEEDVDYNEAGVTNSSASVNMNAIGSYTISFTFLGRTTPSGYGANIVVIAKPTTLTTISASPMSPQPYGTAVTVTATVSSASLEVLTGTVSFFDGGVLLGTAALADGTGSIILSSLTVGTHLLSAAYIGNDSFGGSGSSVISYRINGGVSVPALAIDGGNVVKVYGDPDFTLTARDGPAGAAVWTSSHPELVSVDPNTGVVTIRGATGDTVVKITASKSGSSASVTVTVNKKPVTVTADNKEKRAGEDDPLLTYTVDPEPLARDVLTGSLRYTGKDPGTYDIVEDISFDFDPNYEVTFVKGTMTILDGDRTPWLWIAIISAAICVLIAATAMLYTRGHKAGNN